MNMEPNPTTTQRNPFVGLRPFNSDEALLFFGRRQQTVELLERLHQGRFVAVTGSSGCGKSSLIRAGLIPKLLAGFLVADRDAWRIATLKPGDAPLQNLTKALNEIIDDSALRIPHSALQEGGAQAILEHLQPTLTAANANLLLLVDQFEEIFRFGVESKQAERREEAADFVALLLQLAEQRALPVYVVLTMRSDFLGDCDNFHGLPEALNRSQYLVPRLTREQRRQAIEGPIRLFGAEISPRLLDRVLNDVGDQMDQLPVMQHALMRTWERWEFEEAKRKRDWDAEREGVAAPEPLPLDVPQYEDAGTIKNALAQDAEAALNGMDDTQLKLVERIFRTLTATDDKNRRIRRPAHLSELAAVAGTTTEEVRAALHNFHSGGRSFVLLNEEDDPLVSISHESLIRQWSKMDDFFDNELESQKLYVRLVDAACRYENEETELLPIVELVLATQRIQDQNLNRAWAKRYNDSDDDFDSAFTFLLTSLEAKNKEQRFINLQSFFFTLFLFVMFLVSLMALIQHFFKLNQPLLLKEVILNIVFLVLSALLLPAFIFNVKSLRYKREKLSRFLELIVDKLSH